MARSRSICFTLNNYTEEELENIKNIDCEYLIFGKEKGENGTPHLQGYVHFKNQRKFNSIKKLIGERAHIEAAKGSADQNITYCSKEGDVFEKGIKPRQGSRSDLKRVCESIIENKEGLMMIIKESPDVFVRNYKGLQQLHNRIHHVSRNEKPKVLWLYGPTGVGKTKSVNALVGSKYWKSDGKWFDGYDQQQIFIWDDFRSMDYSFPSLLRLLDRYQYSVEFKGGYVEFNSPIIIFTTPTKPEDLYHHSAEVGHEDLNQLKRRIDHVILVQKDIDLNMFIVD